MKQVCTACLKVIDQGAVNIDCGYFGKPLPVGAVFHPWICDPRRHPWSSEQERR